jgi:hypothetical protein
MPPGTSKTRVRSVPTRSVLDPQRNRPPMLNVLTRETCCRPLPYQVTDMPCGKEIRWWRRAPLGVSVVIRQGKGTSWIGREPIEQKFPSASTLESKDCGGRPSWSLPTGISPKSRLTHLPDKCKLDWFHSCQAQNLSSKCHAARDRTAQANSQRASGFSNDSRSSGLPAIRMRCG